MKTYYKVIEILNEHSIIINYGYKDNSKKNKVVRVISIGPEVFDPESGESIGTLDEIKCELRVTTVYENFSICEKLVSETVNTIFKPLVSIYAFQERPEKLNVDQTQITNKRKPEDKTIRVGDRVEVI